MKIDTESDYLKNTETLSLIENTTESFSYSETKEINCCWKLCPCVEADASKGFQRSSIGSNMYSFTTESCCLGWFRIWTVVLMKQVMASLPEIHLPGNIMWLQTYVCHSTLMVLSQMYTVLKKINIYIVYILYFHTGSIIKDTMIKSTQKWETALDVWQ